MTDDFRLIDTAPRDGSVVEVMDPDCGSFLMRWNPEGTNTFVGAGPGIWEDIEGGFTWAEDHGYGPRWWRPAPPLPSSVAGRV